VMDLMLLGVGVGLVVEVLDVAAERRPRVDLSRGLSRLQLVDEDSRHGVPLLTLDRHPVDDGPVAAPDPDGHRLVLRVGQRTAAVAAVLLGQVLEDLGHPEPDLVGRPCSVISRSTGQRPPAAVVPQGPVLVQEQLPLPIGDHGGTQLGDLGGELVGERVNQGSA
jgi:hypothetical protein